MVYTALCKADGGGPWAQQTARTVTPVRQISFVPMLAWLIIFLALSFSSL
jgi:hypothetical protein